MALAIMEQRHRAIWRIAPILLAAWLPAAGHSAPLEGQFRVGTTGIYCVKAPCPWRGIVPLGADGQPGGKPLWTAQDLPTLKASKADHRRIAAAWKDNGCLIVDGTLEGATFTVNRIDGEC